MGNFISKTLTLFPIFSITAYDQYIHQLEEIEQLEEVNARQTRREDGSIYDVLRQRVLGVVQALESLCSGTFGENSGAVTKFQ